MRGARGGGGLVRGWVTLLVRLADASPTDGAQDTAQPPPQGGCARSLKIDFLWKILFRYFLDPGKKQTEEQDILGQDYSS